MLTHHLSFYGFDDKNANKNVKQVWRDMTRFFFEFIGFFVKIENINKITKEKSKK